MAFELSLSPAVRSETLYALGETIRGNSQNTDKVFKTVVVSEDPGHPKIPAVLYLIQLSLKSEDFSLRALAAYAFEVIFCYMFISVVFCISEHGCAIRTCSNPTIASVNQSE